MYLRARSPEQIDERKNAILKAMDTLYMEKELSCIFLKDVAALAGLSRTAIYSYYSRKEEILLDSLYNHFILLDDELTALCERNIDANHLRFEIAKALEKNVIILKIMSTNLEDIERSTTLENLIVLKKELRRFQESLQRLLLKHFPKAEKETLKYVMYCFITMLYGYYPVTNPMAIQKEAMAKTRTTIETTLFDLISISLGFLFSSLR